MSASASAGVPRLRPVPLPELRWQVEGRHWRVDQPIEGLATLTPVRGELRALHHGNALEIAGEAHTIVTLCCDRCLQPFNHPLHAEAREVLELAGGSDPADGGPIPAEAAGSFVLGDDLDDRLDANGHFDPEQWLFEQLSLRLPLVNRCGSECPGPPSWGDGPSGGDPRWAALRSLRPG